VGYGRPLSFHAKFELWMEGQPFVVRQRVSASKILLDLFEINIPPLNVCVHKLHFEPVADINAFKPVEQPAFDWGLNYADPCPFVGCARADGVELISDP